MDKKLKYYKVPVKRVKRITHQLVFKHAPALLLIIVALSIIILIQTTTALAATGNNANFDSEPIVFLGNHRLPPMNYFENDQAIGVVYQTVEQERLQRLIIAGSLTVLLFAVAFVLVLLNMFKKRKQAEMALQESEVYVKAIIDNLPIGVAVNSVKPEVVFTYMNDNFPKIYHTTSEELYSPGAFWDVVYEDPQFRKELKKRVEDDCASGNPEKMLWENVPITRDGKVVAYISASNTPVPEMNLVISTVWDVTARKVAEDELQANYALLRIAGKTVRFGGWSLDLNSNICTWSDQVAEIHEMPAGYAPPLSEGISFYAPEWREKITEVFTACAEAGIPYDEEMEIITASGRRAWVRTAGEAVRDESGKIIRVQGSFQDITDRKKTEQALYESEERLDLAMAVKNEGIWDWNLLTNETYFDKRYYTMAGYEPDEFPPSFNNWAERVHEEDLPRAQQAIEAYLEGKSDRFNIEFRFKKKNGQWMWINGKGKIYGRDDSGSPLRMIGTHTDITERKEAEAEIRRLNEELEQRVKERTAQLEAVNKELEAFAYSVSHDLRAPLRAMGGFSETLLTEYSTKLDDQGRHYLKRIEAASNRMGDLIDDLLNLSRVTRTELKKQQIDLSKLAAEILTEKQETDPQRKARFEIFPDLSARGDAALLRTVMQNLLENAWKFSANERETKIEVGRTAIQGEEVFFVRDNGSGFNMDYADKLFVPFQRLHRTEEFSGTGIGLATVQRIINRHGGKVWAEGEVGKGAKFYFTLGRVKNEK